MFTLLKDYYYYYNSYNEDHNQRLGFRNPDDFGADRIQNDDSKMRDLKLIFWLEDEF